MLCNMPSCSVLDPIIPPIARANEAPNTIKASNMPKAAYTPRSTPLHNRQEIIGTFTKLHYIQVSCAIYVSLLIAPMSQPYVLSYRCSISYKIE